MRFSERLTQTQSSDALNALGEDPLSAEEAQAVMQEVLEGFKKQQYKYDKEIDLTSDDAWVDDYKLAREAILDSMDKAKVTADIILNMMAAIPESVTIIELLQENIKLIQASSKSLMQLHSNYAKNKNSVMNNNRIAKEFELEDTDSTKIEELLKSYGFKFEEPSSDKKRTNKDANESVFK